MARRVVTISQTDGAAADNLARTVAGRLGYRHVDDEIVQAVAERQGVDSSVVRDVERRRSFMQAFWEALDTGDAPEVAAVAVGGGAYFPSESMAPRRDYAPLLRELIREVIVETADRGDVVVSSHGASFACSGRPDVLRVLVTASTETRARRLAEAWGGDVREATKTVEESDRNRGDYLKRFYGIDREQPTHYDLVVNTDSLGMDEAVELVARAVSA